MYAPRLNESINKNGASTTAFLVRESQSVVSSGPIPVPSVGKTLEMNVAMSCCEVHGEIQKPWKPWNLELNSYEYKWYDQSISYSLLCIRPICIEVWSLIYIVYTITKCLFTSAGMQSMPIGCEGGPGVRKSVPCNIRPRGFLLCVASAVSKVDTSYNEFMFSRPSSWSENRKWVNPSFLRGDTAF